MKVMEKDQAQKQFDEARAQNKTAGQVKQVSKAPARGTDVFSISVNLAPRAAAYFTLTYQSVIFTLCMVREREMCSTVSLTVSGHLYFPRKEE